MGDCSDGPVEDGTAIAICAPDTFGVEGQPDGVTNLVQTDPETARKGMYRCSLRFGGMLGILLMGDSYE